MRRRGLRSNRNEEKKSKWETKRRKGSGKKEEMIGTIRRKA